MIAIGETITRLAMNGHYMEYVVIGHYADGRAKTRQWDAEHADMCPCLVDDRPDW